MAPAIYSVNLWGSHPDDDNDDCCVGDDFPTLGAAMMAYDKPKQHFGHISAGSHYFVELAKGSRDGQASLTAETMLVREVGTKPKDTGSDDDDWRREQAMEAGMLHGIDAYNDAMGYGLGDE